MSKPKTICAYLYSDGHAVLWKQKRDRETGVEIEFVEIIESYGPECRFDGRLVFHNPDHCVLFELSKRAGYVRVTQPSVENGSDNTRSKGIEVGMVRLAFRGGKELWHTIMPSLIRSEISLSSASEAFDPQAKEWGQMPVVKIHRKVVSK